MIWFAYALALAGLLTLQSIAAPYISIGGIRPDFLLVVVIFVSLYGRPHRAIVASWILGLAADLTTIERFGFLGASYGLSAMFVVSIREFLFRYHALTQLGLTFAVAASVQSLWLIYRYALYGLDASLLADFFSGAVPAGLYTAAWAPPVHGALLRMARPFGVARTRYSHAGMGSIRR